MVSTGAGTHSQDVTHSGMLASAGSSAGTSLAPGARSSTPRAINRASVSTATPT